MPKICKQPTNRIEACLSLTLIKLRIGHFTIKPEYLHRID